MHLIGRSSSSEDNSYRGPLASRCNVLEDAEDGWEGWPSGEEVASSDTFEADEHKDPQDTPEKEADSEWSSPGLLHISLWHKGTAWDAKL